MSPEYVQEWLEKAEQDYQTVLLISRQKKRFLYPGEGATRVEAKWAAKQAKELQKILLPKM